MEAQEGILTEYDEYLQRKKNDSSYDVQCHCRKLCKGIHRLQAHQGFCTISDVPELRELFNEETITNGEYFEDNNFEETIFIPQAKLPTSELKLPKTTESWNRAKEFFKSTLDVNIELTNVDRNICHLQGTIYKYFKNECGTVSENDIYAGFRLNYNHLLKTQLETALQQQ